MINPFKQKYFRFIPFISQAQQSGITGAIIIGNILSSKTIEQSRNKIKNAKLYLFKLK